jgi:hypothetical protein
MATARAAAGRIEGGEGGRLGDWAVAVPIVKHMTADAPVATMETRREVL